MRKLLIPVGALLVCLTVGEIHAQPASLAVRSSLAEAGDTVSVAINLTNHVAVSGMSWTMIFDGQVMDPVDVSTTPRTDGMEIHSHKSGDSLRVLLLDGVEGQSLSPSEGAIADVRFRIRDGVQDGTYPLRLCHVTVADTARPPTRVETACADGALSVTGYVASLVTAACVSGDTVGIAVDLRNPEPVLGLQMHVHWSDPDLEFVTATASARAEGLRPFGASPAQGEVTLVLADLSGESLLGPGEGPVMHLWLYAGREMAPSDVSLEIARAAATGLAGEALDLVTRSARMSITKKVNAPPQLTLPESIMAIEDSAFVWSISARDADGDPLTYEALSGPTWIALDSTTGLLTGIPGDGDVGGDVLHLRVSDGVDSVEGELLVEVRNRPPFFITNAPLRARVGGRYRYLPVVENLDGGYLELETRTQGAAIDTVTTCLVWRPTRAGETRFTLTATDPNGGQAVQSFVVVVEPRPRIVIDEILADPPPGAAGDANGDGTRDGKQDEFVEILNHGDEAVDISGWTLSDDDTAAHSRFAFPPETALGPGARAVLFGGGSPSGIRSSVYTDDGTLGNGLTNTGDRVLLVDPGFEDTIAVASYAADGIQAGSLVREPDGGYVPHSAFPGRGLFSPGRARPVAARLTLAAPDTLVVEEGATVRVSAVYSDDAVVDVTDEADLGTDSDRLDIGGDNVISGVSAGVATLHARWNTLRVGKTIVVLGRANRSPVLEPVAALSVLEDAPLQARLLATDPDGDPLSFGLAEGPEWLAVDESGVLSGTPGDSDVGRRRAVVAVSDGEAEVSGQLDIEVINLPPEITGEPLLRARVGVLYRYRPTILNLDGGRAGLHSPVEGAGVDSLSGALSWRPTRAGEAAFTLAATDSNGGQAVQSFVVVVEPRPRIVIDEVLADPPPGAAGDANGDGTRDGKEDEFVEILNQGDKAVDISGWTLSDDDVPASERFVFPHEAILGPGERAVLFGGGDPRGIPGPVYTDDGSIGNGLSNAGDTILLIDPALEDTVDLAAYASSGNPDQSVVRVPGGWERHGDAPGIGPFSPGSARQVATDTASVPYPGSTLDGGSPVVSVPDSTPAIPEDPLDPDADRTETGDIELPSGIVISEILADPAPGLDGDANGDGVRHGYEDEFVELRNTSAVPADLSGCRLGDDDARHGRLYPFPEGTVLPPGGYLTLFGGGQPQGIAGQVFVDDGRIGDGLANGGDRVLLLSDDGADTLASAGFGSGLEGVAWRRDKGDLLVAHNQLPGRGLYSPGRPTPLLVSIRLEPDSLLIAVGETRHLRVVGRFSDSSDEDLTEWIPLAPVDSTVVRLDRDASVLGLRSGRTAVLARWEHYADSSWVRVGPEDTLPEAREAPADTAGKGRTPATDAGTDSTEASPSASGGGDSSDGGDDVGGAGVVDTSQVAPDEVSAAADSAFQIQAFPDTVARVGFLYSCPIEVLGIDSDSVTLRVDGNPGWLALSHNVLVGLPLPGDEGTSRVRLTASDARGFDEIRFQVRAVGDQDHPSPDSLAYVGLTWRWPFQVQDGVHLEIDGEPWDTADGTGLSWRPQKEDEGRRTVTVEVSAGGMSLNTRDYDIVVRPAPSLEVTEILVDPPSDANGDGEVDARADQFIELHNKGETAVDLSGWELGDDDGSPYTFPAGAVMAPGAHFTLFGRSTGDITAGKFSAGGKIGNGLAGADRILLISPAGPDTLVDVDYRGGRIAGSLVPDPAGTSAWVPHSVIFGEAFSPGFSRDPARLPGEEPDTSRTDTIKSDRIRSDKGSEGEATFVLHAPRPNPFNGSTDIGIETDGGRTCLVVYNTLGQPVRKLLDREIPEGIHQVTWHGRDERGVAVGSGVYLIVCRTETQVRTVRAVLLR